MQNPLLALLISAFFIVVAVAFGRRILGLFRVRFESSVESALFGAGLGLGVMAYLVLAVGLLGMLYPWMLMGIVGVMALISIREINSLLLDIISAIKTRATTRLKIIDSLVTAGIVSMGAIGLLGALTPPGGLDWDGLAYHLAIPKLYLAHHAIYYVPYISHSNFPFLTEMLYTIGLSIGSTSIAKLFHFAMFAGTSLTIYTMCKRHVSPLVGKVGALIFMSVPVVLWEAGIAYADITTAFYLTLAVYAVLNWEETHSTSWLTVCGLMGGFALGTKVLAGVPIAALFVWIVASSGSRREWGRGLMLAFGMGIIALLVGSPWYIKSYIYTGNPVYPFMYNIFGGRNWSAENAEAYRASQVVFGMGRDSSQFWLLPWNLAMNGSKFFDTPSIFGMIGIAFLGLIPVQLLTRNYNKVILKVGAVALVFIAAWFVLMQQSRYLIGVLPLLSIVAAAGVESANRQWRIGRYVVNLFLAFSVGLTLLMGILMSMNSAPAALGIEPRSEYVSRTLDVYDAESYINTTLPRTARIVMLDEVRGFYLEREYIWGNPQHHTLIPWSTFKDGRDMVNGLEKMGYTHLLLNWKFSNPGSPQMKLLTDAIGRGWVREIYSDRHNISIYELK